MNSLVALSCLLAVAAANPQLLYSGHYAPTITQQYHAQDELGQYSYGYSGGPSAKEETRTADGITRGSYSYIDGHGLVQSASYVSDPINGFRVAATNLPVGPSAPAAPIAAPIAVAAAPAVYAQAPVAIAGPAETPEVIAARSAHFAAHNEARLRLLGRKRRSVFAAPLAIAPASRFAYSTVSAHAPLAFSHPIASYAAAPIASYAAAAPIASYAAPAPLAYSAPLAVAAPSVGITKTQYHAQDELGQYSYGYADGLSSKQETRRADGITTGGYSYLDANGIVQNVNYVADAAGFRVAATNLPVAPVA